MTDNDIRIASDLRAGAALLESQARELRRRAVRLDPPCGMWLDGHSYAKCSTPRSQCEVHRNVPASMRPKEDTND